MFTDIDLTRDHLIDVDHHITPRTRDDEEAARRRALMGINPDLLALEGQARGQQVAMRVLQLVEGDEDVVFANQIVAESGVNSAWYTAARDAKEMRKRLKIPQLATRASTYRPDGVEIFQRGQVALSNASRYGDHLLKLLTSPEHIDAAEVTARRYGQFAAGAGLHLSCIALANTVAWNETLSPDDISAIVREQNMRLIRSSRERAQQVGEAPSFKGLAFFDSELAQWWRSEAPFGAYQALRQAQAEHNVTP